MDRSIPLANKLVSKRIDEKNRQIHLAKLNCMKSRLSQTPPQTFVHLKLNKKKHQLYEDRLTEIQRENKILLDKLTSIMRSNNHSQSIDPNHRSLNRDFRKRELVKITIENQAILKRLQDQKSIYKRQEWDEDRRQQEIYLKNISEHPILLTNHTISQSTDVLLRRPRTFQANREDKSGIASFMTSASYQMNSSMKNSIVNKKYSPIKKSANQKLDPMTPLSSKKVILYEAKRKIGFSTYTIQIYYHNNTFNIIASNNDRADLKALSMSQKEGEDLISQYNENYDELVDKIRFKGSNIIFEDNSFVIDTIKRENVYNKNQIIEVKEENESKNLSAGISRLSQNDKVQKDDNKISSSKNFETEKSMADVDQTEEEHVLKPNQHNFDNRKEDQPDQNEEDIKATGDKKSFEIKENSKRSNDEEDPDYPEDEYNFEEDERDEGDEGNKEDEKGANSVGEKENRDYEEEEQQQIYEDNNFEKEYNQKEENLSEKIEEDYEEDFE